MRTKNERKNKLRRSKENVHRDTKCSADDWKWQKI